VEPIIGHPRITVELAFLGSGSKRVPCSVADLVLTTLEGNLAAHQAKLEARFSKLKPGVQQDELLRRSSNLRKRLE
jgi:hypothetical protein